MWNQNYCDVIPADVTSHVVVSIWTTFWREFSVNLLKINNSNRPGKLCFHHHHLEIFSFPLWISVAEKKKRNFLLELCLLHSDSANKSSPTLVEVGAHFYPIFLVKNRHCGTILDHLVWQVKKSTICTIFLSCSDQELGKSYA